MAEHRVNNKVSLDLPQDYGFSKSFDDDGNEIYSIFKGCTIDEDGEESYEFKCTMRETIIERNAETEGKSFGELWVNAFQHQENVRYLILPGKPDTLMLTLGTGINIFGRVLKLVSLTTMVAVDENSFLTLISSKGYNEENPEDYLPVVESVLKVVRSLVINGKGHALEPIAASNVLDALKPSFDGSAPAEVSIGLNVKVNTGDETVTYKYSDRAPSTEHLIRMQPDESLYPHYLSIKNNPASFLGAMGAKVVINGTGTEYEFKSLQKELTVAASDPDSDLSEQYRTLYQRIIDADHSEYNLDERAKEMLPLFRVDPSVFDTKHDRECELAEGYMHRAYMMSALRSFAWTLSDWCRNKNIQPEDLLYGDLQYIISHISIHEWLNYDADTYCVGLCGCQDLHVYYVPDGVSYSDRQALLPDAEHLAQIEAIRKQFPGFKEIPTQVHSLDALREDLSYILPAIETIYDALAEERNRMEPLSGDAADILYAWCALALAAKGPFFTEDGPINCWYTQKCDDAPYTKTNSRGVTAKSTKAKRAASTDCTISFSGILESYNGEDSSIILPEGINAIGTDAFSFNKTLKTVIFSDEVETIEADAFWGCLALEEVVFPASLRTICKNAFRGCESLKTIIIPEGVCEIEEDVFTGCMQLTDIYLPGSLCSIGYDAFCTFNHETIIHAPKGSDAVSYAKKHDIKFDHKKPASKKIPSNKNKSDVDKNKAASHTKKTISFDQEKSMVLANGLSVPVPDGYRGYSEGTGVNAGWVYVVPENILADSNHIDVKPYSFAITVSPGAHLAFEPKYIDALKKVFLSKGYLSDEVSVESLIVSDNCGFLYQDRTDVTDATYNKLNGFLFAGEDVFQFHVYANHESGIAHEPTTIDSFHKICLEWMQRVQRIRVGVGVSSETVDSRQLTPDECVIDADGVFEGYHGSKTDIILPDTVQRIGSFCRFADTVTTVAIPESVTIIEEYAFNDCSGLSQIIISDNVRSIGKSAFSGCAGLSEITIPGCITTIEENTFWKCSGLSNVIIPDGVIKIENSAFSECNSLTDLVIPDSVTSIGDWAFSRCSELKTITISDNITELDSIAFYNCKAVSKIIISPGSKRVPNWISNFAGSLEEIVIPDSVTAIEETAFSECKKLTNIIIPNGVTTIGKEAFEGCSSLTNVTIPGSVVSIEEFAFKECSGLTELQISDGVVSIGKSAFSGCVSLKNVLIPQSVKNLGDDVFCNCTGLHTVAIPDLAMNSRDAFWGCDNLSKVILLPGSSSVPFGFCWLRDSLEEIVIPEGVTCIEEEALSGCSKLTSIVLPDSVEIIENGAFMDCTGLTSIQLSDNLTEIGLNAFASCTALEAVILPEGLRTIGEQAFSDCTGLKVITIPESVTEIGDNAFDEDILIRCYKNSCMHTYAQQQKLRYTLIHPDGSADIEEDETVDAAMYTETIGTEGVIYQPNHIESDEQPVAEFEIDEDGVFVGYHGSAEELTLPDTVTVIRGFEAPSVKRIVIPGTVREIEESAFFGCDHLEEIVIENGMVSIGNMAFSDCTNLRRIILPDSLKSIGESAFENCTALTSIRIPSGVTTLNNFLFNCCSELASVELADGIMAIGAFAFSECRNLVDITIPDSVAVIDDHAFNECSSLSLLKLPGGITEIKESVFQYCTNLTEVILPENITTIEESAFYGCEKLTAIVLPDSVSSIGSEAFSHCNGLKTLKLPTKLKGTLEKDTFRFCEQLERIVLPVGITAIAESVFIGCKQLKDIHLPPFIKEIHENAFQVISADAVFHVIKGTYPEHFCQEKGYKYDHNMDPELLKILQAIVRARKAQAEAKRCAEEEQKLQERRERYQKFVKAIEIQKQIISQNKGLFGSQAHARKEAQEKLARLEKQMEKEFPDGKT